MSSGGSNSDNSSTANSTSAAAAFRPPQRVPQIDVSLHVQRGQLGQSAQLGGERRQGAEVEVEHLERGEVADALGEGLDAVVARQGEMAQPGEVEEAPGEVGEAPPDFGGGGVGERNLNFFGASIFSYYCRNRRWRQRQQRPSQEGALLNK